MQTDGVAPAENVAGVQGWRCYGGVCSAHQAPSRRWQDTSARSLICQSKAVASFSAAGELLSLITRKEGGQAAPAAAVVTMRAFC